MRTIIAGTRRPLLTLVLMLLAPLVVAQEVVEIHAVDRLLSNVSEPPPHNADWHAFVLHGPVRVGNLNRDQRTWFRFSIARPEDFLTRSYALYFWRYNMSLTLYMNGREIGGDQFREGFHTTAWNRGYVAKIHPRDWLPGENEFHIRFNPSPFGGTFTHVKFGDAERLEAAWQRALFWKIQLNEYLLGFSLLAALCALTLWLFRRSDGVYLWFFGVCLAWSLVTSHMVIYFNPITYGTWLPLVHVAIDSWIFFLFGFLNRILDYRHQRLQRVMFVVWSVALLSHAFSPREVFWMLAYLFHLVLVSGLVWMFLRAMVDAIQRHSKLALAICLAMLGQLSFAAHDFWLFFGASEAAWESSQHLAQFGVPLLLAVLLIALIVRFAQALDVAEKMNEELEDRVDESRQALQRSFEERHQLELAKAAAEERQKIYRDLHDDVGSKLLAIAHQEREGSVARLATTALESIREAVYRSNYQDEPLLEFLSAIREEVRMRTDAQDVVCRWFEDPDLPTGLLDSSQCYHVSRIIRELVTNSLAHSECTEVRISVEIDDDIGDQLLLEYFDNGHGLTPQPSQRSSGLGNIAFRAEQLGSEAVFDKMDTGTRFHLRFKPLFVNDSTTAQDRLAPGLPGSG